MKKIMKLLLWGVLLLLVLSCSFFFSRDILIAYNKVLYALGGGIEKAERGMKSLYKEGDYRKIVEKYRFNEENYGKSNDINHIVLLSLIKLNKLQDAATLLVTLSEKNKTKNLDFSGLLPLVQFLYKEGNYGDLVYLYDRGFGSSHVNFEFYYGAALYRMGRLGDSEKMLNHAFENGYIGVEINYYIALLLEKRGKLNRAIFFMNRARVYDTKNRDILLNLVRLYRKKGDYKQAESFLRMAR